MKGMIFTGESVRAIGERRKTMTRRVINPQPYRPEHCFGLPMAQNDLAWLLPKSRGVRISNKPNGPDGWAEEFARYRVGETVYVKETWLHEDGWYPDEKWKNTFVAGKGYTTVDFRADVTHDDLREIAELGYKWRSPLHMPAWAARYFLRVDAVRVERLNEISEADAIAEGINVLRGLLGERVFWDYESDESRSPLMFGAIDSFCTLWNSINGRKHPWDSNPWVEAYTFTVVDKPAEVMA